MLAIKCQIASVFVKIYGEKKDGQWSLICLDFCLAAQAPTISEALGNLQGQVEEYLLDALHGMDAKYCKSLLRRYAPIKYWVKWWFANCGVLR